MKLYKVPRLLMDELQKLGYDRELHIIKNVNNPFIINYKDQFYLNDKRFAIVMELANQGDFQQFIEKRRLQKKV